MISQELLDTTNILSALYDRCLDSTPDSDCMKGILGEISEKTHIHPFAPIIDWFLNQMYHKSTNALQCYLNEDVVADQDTEFEILDARVKETDHFPFHILVLDRLHTFLSREDSLDFNVLDNMLTTLHEVTQQQRVTLRYLICNAYSRLLVDVTVWETNGRTDELRSRKTEEVFVFTRFYFGETAKHTNNIINTCILNRI